MGKFVLGILAVFVLQIAFGIYISNQSTADLAATAVRSNITNVSNSLRAIDELAGSDAQQNPAATRSETQPRPIAADDSTDANIDVDNETPNRFAGIKDRRQNAVVRVRQPVERYQVQGTRASVEREYFGSMVVERRFGRSGERPTHFSGDITRQYFGRMMVERRSTISLKKNSYYAKNSESKGRAIGSRS
ncbi:MAG: hypothetical protein ACR2IH_14015 [Pyrinomonadaceae bacterium]